MIEYKQSVADCGRTPNKQISNSIVKAVYIYSTHLIDMTGRLARQLDAVIEVGSLLLLLLLLLSTANSIIHRMLTC